jgi:hypothetical protein
MMTPMMTIPSVEPISETPPGWGVAVGWKKNVAAERFPCWTGCVEYVSAALNNARIKLNPTVRIGRTNFFIIFEVYHVLILTESYPLYVLTFAFEV